MLSDTAFDAAQYTRIRPDHHCRGLDAAMRQARGLVKLASRFLVGVARKANHGRCPSTVASRRTEGDFPWVMKVTSPCIAAVPHLQSKMTARQRCERDEGSSRLPAADVPRARAYTHVSVNRRQSVASAMCQLHNRSTHPAPDRGAEIPAATSSLCNAQDR